MLAHVIETMIMVTNIGVWVSNREVAEPERLHRPLHHARTAVERIKIRSWSVSISWGRRKRGVR
jgi:hypothetical protein